MKDNKLLDNIKRRNAAFKEATNPKKRVMIMKEVLRMLDAKNIRAHSGNYFFIPNQKERTAWRSMVNDSHLAKHSIDARDAFKKISRCYVCARGAALVAAVALRNRCSIEEFNGEGGISEFTDSQLMLIENYFEGWSGYSIGEFPHVYHPKAFRMTHKKADDRLRLIAKNIIKNKGTFEPTQLPVSKEALKAFEIEG